MKKMITCLIVLCLLGSRVMCVFAKNNDEKFDISEYVVTEETQDSLMGIPMYATFVEGNKELSDYQKESIAGVIQDDIEKELKTINMQDEKADSDKLLLEGEEYFVCCLDEMQKENILSSPIYTLTFNTIQKIVEDGVNVTYIHLYLPTDEILVKNYDVMSIANGDLDDPEFWEANYPCLQVQDGYRFLYTQTDLGIETSEKDFGEITGSINWDDFLTMTVQYVCDMIIDNEVYQAVSTATSVLLDVLGIYEPPISVEYGINDSYIEGKVSGALHIRTVLIRDDLDRVKGYAYYPWATTNRSELALRVDAKYPYYEYGDENYLYRYPSHTEGPQYCWTPGFNGNATFLREVISYYEATHVYMTYEEYLNMDEAIWDMLS